MYPMFMSNNAIYLVVKLLVLALAMMLWASISDSTLV